MGGRSLALRPPGTGSYYERPFLVRVVGYPAADAVMPAIDKHSLDTIATFV